MTQIILECLNDHCAMRKPYGTCVEISDLPSLDPDATALGAQTDWPICEVCQEPMTLGETVEVDDDFVLSLVNDAEEHCGPAAVERLIDLAVERAKQLKSAGSEGTDETGHS